MLTWGRYTDREIDHSDIIVKVRGIILRVRDNLVGNDSNATAKQEIWSKNDFEIPGLPCSVPPAVSGSHEAVRREKRGAANWSVR